MRGVIASDLTCWDFPRRWFRWAIRETGCRSACRSSDGLGKKKLCWRSPRNLNRSADPGKLLQYWTETRVFQGFSSAYFRKPSKSVCFLIPDVQTSSTLLQSALRADFALPFLENRCIN